MLGSSVTILRTVQTKNNWMPPKGFFVAFVPGADLSGNLFTLDAPVKASNGLSWLNGSQSGISSLSALIWGESNTIEATIHTKVFARDDVP